MPIFDSFKDSITKLVRGRGVNTIDEPVSDLVLGASSAGGAPPVTGTEFLLASYSTMPWLRAVTGKIAKSISATTWKLYIVRGPNRERAIRMKSIQRAGEESRSRLINKVYEKGELEEIDDHPFLDLLHEGNPRMSGSVLFELTSIYKDIVGEAFWLIEKNLVGAPVAVWPIPSHWVRALPVTDFPFYRVRVGAHDFDVPITSVISFVENDPLQPYGRGSGIAKTLGDELETDEFAAKHTSSFFRNNARPDIIISADGLSRADTVRLEQDWNEKHRGFWNSFKAHFINRKINIQTLSQNIGDMQLRELREMERNIIMQVYSLPPEKMGVLNACHDEETECLTRDGWKTYDSLREWDKIATLNPTSGKIEYHKPTNIFVYEYEGKVHHWHGQRFDVRVTPNHRMYVKCRELSYHNSTENLTDFYQMMTSEELAIRGRKGQRTFLAACNGYEGKREFVHIPYVVPHSNSKSAKLDNFKGWDIKVEDFAAFLGYWVSEGSIRTKGGDEVRIAQNPGKVSELIKCSLDALSKYENLGVVYNGEYEQGISCAKSLKEWLKNKVGNRSWNKRLPNEVFEWNMDCKVSLLKALIDGDGHWGKETKDRNNIRTWMEVFYSTTSEKLADDVQRLALECGLRAVKKFVKHYGSKRDQFIIRLTANIKENRFSANLHKHFDVEDYKGIVWCVEIPNGIFVTRRKGQISFHGNSNRSTIESADAFYTKDILMPRIEAVRNTMQNQLIPMFDDRLILDYESPIIEDKEHQLAVMSSMPGAFTVNEWRDEARKESLGDEGEIFLMRAGEGTRSPDGSYDEEEPEVEDEGDEEDEEKVIEDMIQTNMAEIKRITVERIKEKLKAS